MLHVKHSLSCGLPHPILFSVRCPSHFSIAFFLFVFFCCFPFFSVTELVSRLSEAQLLPVSQVLLRLYTAINAHRASPGHVRQRVLRSAVPRRGSAASEVLSSVHSAVLQAVAPSCDVGRAVSSAMVYPGVLVAAAVLLDRKGAVKDWRDDFFRTSGECNSSWFV